MDEKRRSFRLTCAKTKARQNVWWRVYSSNGERFDCGLSSDNMPQDCESFRTCTDNSVFAWTPFPSRETQFSPHEILPIPASSGECVSFEFTETGSCRPSHGVVFVSNQGCKDVLVKVFGGNVAVVLVPPNKQSQEIVYKVSHSVETLLTIVAIDETNTGQHCTCMDVSNGDTVAVNAGLAISRQSFECLIPVYDVPVRCLNYSGEDALVECQFVDSGFHTLHVCAGQAPTIIWLASHPTVLKWRTDSASATEPYKSGMTLTIRSPEAQQAAKTVLESDHAADAPAFVELLEEVGELVECAPLFVNQRVEFAQLPLLSDGDWDALRLPIGSKHRVRERVRQLDSCSAGSGKSFDYDLFLCHRQVGGEDLAQAIKLQLQVMFPKRHLRIFLDVDDLTDKTRLCQIIRRSRAFALILTPSVLESSSCQMQIAAALGSEKLCVIVHDIKNCPFPSSSSVSERIRPILDSIAIPYYRSQQFRDTAMMQIAKALGFLPK